MQIQNHIISGIPVFKVNDSMKKVVLFFETTAFSHVAVTENGRYLGLLSENDVENFKIDETIEGYRYNLEDFFVGKETNWLDVLEVFARNDSNLLPILGDEGKVLGYYDLTDVVGVFIDTPFFTDPGNILVIAKGIKDYSFSEVVQIVESNNAKFIGGFVTNITNDVVQITIKIGTPNFNDVAQTFRRYGYNIIFGNMEDKFLEDLKGRSAYLDKYLNV